MSEPTAIGFFDGPDVAFAGEALARSVERFRETTFVVRDPATRAVGVAFDGTVGARGLPILAVLPPLYPEWLGDRAFNETHRVRFPYVTGAMANGIATTTVVIEMARAEMLGFFGAAGLGRERVEAAVDEQSPSSVTSARGASTSSTRRRNPRSKRRWPTC